MKTHKEIWDGIAAYAKEQGISIRFKETSWFMRLLGALLFFNPKFMTEYITTIHKTVYWPGRSEADIGYRDWEVLAHECVHAYDSKRLGFPVFGFLIYLMPQSLGILTLLLLPLWICTGWWWGLLGLLFLAPIPSPGRRWVEMRGYSMTLACYAWYSEISYRNMAFITRQFTSGAYYFMWPFPKGVMRALTKWHSKIQSGEYEKEVKIAADIRRIIQG